VGGSEVAAIVRRHFNEKPRHRVQERVIHRPFVGVAVRAAPVAIAFVLWVDDPYGLFPPSERPGRRGFELPTCHRAAATSNSPSSSSRSKRRWFTSNVRIVNPETLK
jgi:hypothetical protein